MLSTIGIMCAPSIRRHINWKQTSLNERANQERRFGKGIARSTSSFSTAQWYYVHGASLPLPGSCRGLPCELPLWAAHAYLGFTPKPFEFCLTRAVPETPATGLG
jgi:hypothetical protein